MNITLTFIYNESYLKFTLSIDLDKFYIYCTMPVDVYARLLAECSIKGLEHYNQGDLTSM